MKANTDFNIALGRIVNINVNERRQQSKYSCHKAGILPTGLLQTNFEIQPIEHTVMRSVRIDYNPNPATQDASYSFFCCALQAE